MTFFSACTTPDEIRATYRKLAKEHHPGMGRDTGTMQKINAAYEAALKQMSGRQFDRTAATDDGRTTWTYYYDEQVEQDIAEAIDTIVAVVGNAPDVEITLVGLWVWVVGNTRPIKDGLKAAGCYWNAKRDAWNWKPAGIRSRYNKNKTLQDILDEGQRIQRRQQERIA